MPKKKVTDAVEEPTQETIPVEQALAQMPRRQGSEDLLELNDLERGVTREDSEEAKWGYLAGAVRRQQILTGIVSAGMTYTENGMPIVPIDFEGLCVKIPVREMTLIEWPEVSESKLGGCLALRSILSQLVSISKSALQSVLAKLPCCNGKSATTLQDV